MKKIQIKGKDYIEVNERIKEFRSLHPLGSITTEMLSNENGVCIIKAYVSIDNEIKATGHAYEVEGNSFINKTSYIENCETSAVGRALGMLGIGIDTSVASADEVQNAVKQQNTVKQQNAVKQQNKSNQNKPKSAQRPYQPEIIKKGIESKSKSNTDKITPATSKKINAKLTTLTAGSKAGKEVLLVYLFNTNTTKELTEGQGQALNDWIKVFKNEAGEFVPTDYVLKEFKLIVGDVQ